MADSNKSHNSGITFANISSQNASFIPIVIRAGYDVTFIDCNLWFFLFFFVFFLAYCVYDVHVLFSTLPFSRAI